MNWVAFSTTFQLAATTSLILLFVGAPIAYWLTYSSRRWKFLIEAVVALPLVLPPTVLGFYILLSFGSRSFLGRWFETLVGNQLPFSFEGLVFASVIYSLPFAVQPMASSFANVDRKYLEASWSLGASRLVTFFRIVVPQCAAGILTALVLSFAHTVGEFGVVLMVGGNIEGVTRTISIDIYDDVQALNYIGANETALVLLLFSFVVLSMVYGLNRKVWSTWPN